MKAKADIEVISVSPLSSSNISALADTKVFAWGLHVSTCSISKPRRQAVAFFRGVSQTLCRCRYEVEVVGSCSSSAAIAAAAKQQSSNSKNCQEPAKLKRACNPAIKRSQRPLIDH